MIRRFGVAPAMALIHGAVDLCEVNVMKRRLSLMRGRLGLLLLRFTWKERDR